MTKKNVGNPRKSEYTKAEMKDRHVVLSKKDIQEVSSECGNEITLEQTLADIGRYIRACNDMYDNPLTNLRRHFTKLTWAYHEPETPEDFFQIAKTADYVWVAYENGEWTYIIVARVKDEIPESSDRAKMLVGSPRDWGNSKLLDKLRRAGIKFIETGS